MAPKKILFVLSSHDKHLSGEPTGWWLVRPPPLTLSSTP
jgi:hypothetical protein